MRDSEKVQIECRKNFLEWNINKFNFSYKGFDLDMILWALTTRRGVLVVTRFVRAYNVSLRRKIYESNLA